MKVCELIKRIKSNGWRLDEHGSSHDFYRHPTKPNTIPVPRHQSQEINPKTAHKILKDAGLK